LKANLALSSCIAITGIGIPVGFSFVLQSLANATPLQAFAAGAALCSTSLGTTFTVLRASGFISSRLGVVLASAAMMDDVVGLVMVQIISNLGASGASISAVTVVRPLLISVGFAVCTPLACLFVAKPFTVWLNAQRTKRPQGLVNRTLTASGAAWTIHTAILVGLVTGSTYAGTSNLFAAYIAGAAISWWDSEVVHPAFDGPETRVPAATSAGYDTPASRADATPTAHQSSEACQHASRTSGLETFEMYYSQPLERILKPFFFVR
jgi:Kef-type K+ transport system membrane component KefB